MGRYKTQMKKESFNLHLFSLLFVFFTSISFANGMSSDVQVNIGVGQAPVLVINQFFIEPDDVPIGNPVNFTIEVSNIGNIDGNASSIIQIYDGSNVIDTFISDIHVVPYLPPNNISNVSVIHAMNYSIGNYTALGFIQYNNKTIGPILKNFSINKGQPPFIYLVSPENHSWTEETNNTLEFIFYVDDVDSSVFSCQIYVDNTLAGSNPSVSKLTNTSLKSNISFSNGVHSWYVKCTDNGGNQVQSQIREFNSGSFCSILDVDNLNYRLFTNLSSNQTCFTITADNVTLDCQGNSITFNSGSPIIIQGSNTTIKNCVLTQNQSMPAIGIQFASEGTGSSLINNTIDLIGDSSTGLYLLSGNSIISNNIISLHGENSTALSFINSSSNLISNNTFTLDMPSSTFVSADESSSGNSLIDNNYIPSSQLEGFTLSIYVNQSGANVTLPKVKNTPQLGIYIPENSIESLTQINITTLRKKGEEVQINVASGKGNIQMHVNISTSRESNTNDSNPYVFTLNASELNLSSTDESRLGFFYYNSSSSKWEAIASSCNSTSHICNAYLTHFSEFGWIVKIPEEIKKEKETLQVSLSGKLSCTKELAEVTTEPDASVEVRFLEQPYANSLIKVGKADANGKFYFIADLPGRYQVAVTKTGMNPNSMNLVAADDCVPRITFVRKWFECTTTSCSLNIPVMTTQMKNVEVDLSEVAPLMTTGLTIKDKYNSQISFYSFVGNKLTLPLITDSFTISSPSNVKMQQINNFTNGNVKVVFQTSNQGRVSGFVLTLSDFKNYFIKNITYVNQGVSYPITRYKIEGSKITIDHQLYISPSSYFLFEVSQVPLTCSADSDCPSDSRCSSGTCVVISCPCGYISNRTCIPYECCADSDCPSGKSCLSHICIYTPPSITEEEKRYIADRLNVLVTTIQSAREQGEDVTTASQLLDQARVAYEAGDFEKAKELLTQAQQIFTMGREVTPEFPYLTAMLVGVVILVLIFAYLLISRLAEKDKPWKPRKR